MLFKTSFVYFESSIGMVVAPITGRHSKAAESVQTQLPLTSLFHGRLGHHHANICVRAKSS